MFARILRDTVIPTKSRANLRELDRSAFVDETPAGLLAIKCLEQRVWFKAGVVVDRFFTQRRRSGALSVHDQAVLADARYADDRDYAGRARSDDIQRVVGGMDGCTTDCARLVNTLVNRQLHGLRLRGRHGGRQGLQVPGLGHCVAGF
jgi:hypothetical protein